MFVVWWMKRVYDGVIEEWTEWMCAYNTHPLRHSEVRIHAFTHPLTLHALTHPHMHAHTHALKLIYMMCMQTITCAVTERLSLFTISA